MIGLNVLVGGVYIICSSVYEECCDTTGVGGECCGTCEDCYAGACTNSLDSGPCRGYAGKICCIGVCVDPQTDNNNCGDCGVECATEAGENCCFGVCIVGPPCV